MTNEDRAILAQDALETHPDYHLNDQTDNVTDLLANLMHLCDAIGISFDRSLESARMHYEAEREEEPAS